MWKSRVKPQERAFIKFAALSDSGRSNIFYLTYFEARVDFCWSVSVKDIQYKVQDTKLEHFLFFILSFLIFLLVSSTLVNIISVPANEMKPFIIIRNIILKKHFWGGQMTLLYYKNFVCMYVLFFVLTIFSFSL